MSVTDLIKAHVDRSPDNKPEGAVLVMATITFRRERLISKQAQDSFPTIDLVKKTELDLKNEIADEIRRIFG